MWSFHEFRSITRRSHNFDIQPSSLSRTYVSKDVRDKDGLKSAIGFDTVILLAATQRQHSSVLYYDADGERITSWMPWTRTVSKYCVYILCGDYGMNRSSPLMSLLRRTFNDYGNAKLEAEQLLQAQVSMKTATHLF